MGTRHIVQQGEHLSGIGAARGFSIYDPIWNAAENGELKSKRKNPHVLLPGDEIVIPEIEPRSESCPTDLRHKFVKKAKPLKLLLKVEHQYGKPVSAETCDFWCGADRQPLSMSAGSVETKIREDLNQARLSVQEKLEVGGSEIEVSLEIEVKIGFLDPIDEPSGQRGRLRNLGYYPLFADAIDDKLFQAAVEEFQCEQGLTVDGICGPVTQAKLKSVHGC